MILEESDHIKKDIQGVFSEIEIDIGFDDLDAKALMVSELIKEGWRFTFRSSADRNNVIINLARNWEV